MHVLSAPPAFILSQDRTLRSKTDRRSGLDFLYRGADPVPKTTLISDSKNRRGLYFRTHFDSFFFGLSLVDLIDRSIRFSRFAASLGPPCGARKYIRGVRAPCGRESGSSHILHKRRPGCDGPDSRRARPPRALAPPAARHMGPPAGRGYHLMDTAASYSFSLDLRLSIY